MQKKPDGAVSTFIERLGGILTRINNTDDALSRNLARLLGESLAESDTGGQPRAAMSGELGSVSDQICNIEDALTVMELRLRRIEDV